MKAQKRTNPTIEVDLLADVQSQVLGCGMSLPTIAREAGIGQRWLYSIMDGTTPDPGYKRLQYLQKWFANRQRYSTLNKGKKK